ncbi:DICT sensory domain-containing protein [Halostella salina]|uniref:DICT sensory domain-containing protein n=1 Tax=Halostella salina TaxID=1547897 RepID=UPI000EF7DB2F|nr:DICT sensory domain-containing protein [Halostella salina]
MSLRGAIAEARADAVEVGVYAPKPFDDLADLFAARNVTVTHRRYPNDGTDGFVVVRRDGEFRGALPVAHVRDGLSPSPRRPGERRDDAFRRFMDLFEGAAFAASDRRQLLATTREIEDRAWRVGRGTLYVGFQRPEALAAQRSVYERFGERDDLAVHLYVAAEWDRPAIPGVRTHVTDDDEISAVWFVVFEGGGSDENKCALLAEEHDPGEYRGVWTYDPARVDDVTAHLRAAY